MIDKTHPHTIESPLAADDWTIWHLTPDLDEQAMTLFGELLALKLRPGDTIALTGDLGAGKTTLARSIIRATLGDPFAEVPSPTYPIVQDYQATRLNLYHYDFYRLGGPDEVEELGFDEALQDGTAIVEWPERAWSALPPDRIEINLESSPRGSEARCVTAKARGEAASRLARVIALREFLAAHLTRNFAAPPRISYLQGDASPRAYARLTADDHSAIVMDAPRMPDGPPVHDGLPYSRIAHLAEDVSSFVAIGRHLATCDVTVPTILAEDQTNGILLIEDLGDLTFARALTLGEHAGGANQHTLWQAALKPLAHLHAVPPPSSIPTYDTRAMEIECRLVLDWMWPALNGGPPAAAARAAFQQAWTHLIDRVANRREGIVLRDYHSPNLMWLSDRPDLHRVGILDFQDALAGPPAYDVVSLLQDARLDVPADLERRLLDAHIRDLLATGRLLDENAFRTDYAILGAQRASKILGIFVRLSRRDGKHGYLAHLPRISEYLERNLQHPALASVRDWFEAHLPAAARSALGKSAPR